MCLWNMHPEWVYGFTQHPQTQPSHPSTHSSQLPSGPTMCTSALKIETRFSSPGQKTSLTQETELLESLLQEVEHQVGASQQIKAFFHTVSTSCCSELWDKDVAATLAQQQLHSVVHMLSQTATKHSYWQHLRRTSCKNSWLYCNICKICSYSFLWITLV